MDIAGPGSLWLLAMHSVVDFFAFGHWTNGHQIRSLSVSGESGSILEDIGPRLPFELPFWDGAQRSVVADDEADGDNPLPFHPLELGEAALLAVLGFQYEGFVDPSHIDPGSIPMCRFARSRPRWRFWR